MIVGVLAALGCAFFLACSIACALLAVRGIRDRRRPRYGASCRPGIAYLAIVLPPGDPARAKLDQRSGSWS